MTCLDPEWGTVIQDQVNNAKDLNELMKILTVVVMNNYPLVAVRMWVLPEEAPERTTFFQHLNHNLELVDFSKLKELVGDCYKTAFFFAISTTKDNKLHKWMLEKPTENGDNRQRGRNEISKDN